VDQDARVIRQLAQSAKELGLEAEIRTSRVDLLGDPAAAVHGIPEEEDGFSLVFADAPYSAIGSVSPLLAALAGAGRLTPGAWVVIEHPATHHWSWPNGLASEADYRYGQTSISLGVHAPEKGRQ
jgi:16S rRNA G966 N2-methylase RsmD